MVIFFNYTSYFTVTKVKNKRFLTKDKRFLTKDKNDYIDDLDKQKMYKFIKRSQS